MLKPRPDLERAPAPGPLEFEGGGSGPQLSHEDKEMPVALREHLPELECWAIANRRDAKRDSVAFWIL